MEPNLLRSTAEADTEAKKTDGVIFRAGNKRKRDSEANLSRPGK